MLSILELYFFSWFKGLDESRLNNVLDWNYISELNFFDEAFQRFKLIETERIEKKRKKGKLIFPFYELFISKEDLEKSLRKLRYSR